MGIFQLNLEQFYLEIIYLFFEQTKIFKKEEGFINITGKKDLNMNNQQFLNDFLQLKCLLCGKFINNIKQLKMPAYQILQSINKLSLRYPLNGSKSSWIGCIGTLMIFALLLGFCVPVCVSYFKGNFYQSMYQTNQSFQQTFYTSDDFKLALVFRNKMNGSVYNHSHILNNLKALAYSTNKYNVYYEPLQLCDQQYFQNDINGIVLEDCLIIPKFVEYGADFAYSSFRYMNFSILPPPLITPFARSTFKMNMAQQIYTDILKDYYTEFYFTQKIITKEGIIKFKLHRAYSTQLNVGSDTIGANFNIIAGLRTTLMDNSVMPWKNKKNITTISWAGKYQGYSALTLEQAAINGIQQSFSIINNLQIAVRYYKKIDWLIGIIGGGMFLFYAIFRVVFNYINRWLMIIDLVNEQILQKTTQDNPKNEDDLAVAKIPVNYIFKRLLPFLRNKNYEKLLKQSQNNNDIVLLVKKQKVTLRNLKKKDIFLPFKPKIVYFKLLQQLNQIQTSQAEQSDIVQNQQEQQQSPPKRKKLINQNQVIDLSNVNIMQQKIRQNPQKKQQKQISSQANREPLQIQPIIIDQQSNVQENGQFIQIEQQAVVNNSENKKKSKQNLQPIQNKQSGSDNINSSLQYIPMVSQNQIVSPKKQILQDQFYNSLINNSQRDSKLNITAYQLNQIKSNKQLNKIYQNNPTYHTILQQKPPNYQEDMQFQSYDKWQGHYKLKKKRFLTKCKDFVTAFLKFVDIFAVRVSLINKSSSSLKCGLFLTLAILVLSILTFALTFTTLNDIQYNISENYVPLNSVSFSQKTSNKFNAVLCIKYPSFYFGGNKFASINFFTVTDGVYQTFQPVQLKANDPVLNLPDGLKFFPFTIALTNCYKYPDNAQIKIDNVNSYFGFNITAYCPGTSSYCSSNQASINKYFMTAVIDNSLIYILPGSRLDPLTNQLRTDVFTVPTVNLNLVKMNINMSLEETAYGNTVNLYDDTDSNFMRLPPILKDTNINFGENNRKTYVKAQHSIQPSYTFKVKLNQASTDYTLTKKKMDWFLGMIGGIFVFWYAVIHVLQYFYMRFNFNAYIAKIIYYQDGYDEIFIKKMIAMLRIPRFLIPKCFDLRKDICRMKQMHDKIDNTLSHLTLLKYTDSCFRLSSSFFQRVEAKNFSLLYFRQKVDENEQVVIRQQVEDQQQQQQQYNVQQQQIILDNLQVKEEEYDLKSQQQKEIQKSFEYQGENENIIDPKVNRCTDYFDIFDQPATFTFKGSRTFSTITGGICGIITIIFVIIVAYYQIGLYLNGTGSTTSYDIIIDDAVGNKGVSLITGHNFKIGVNFMNSTSITAIDPTPYLSTVGISLILQQFTRNNGIITPKISKVDLIPCPTGYLESWITPNVDMSYFAGLRYAYCAPDGISLQISGLPQEQVRKSFKLSIYNKAGNTTGLTNLTTLLNTTFIMLHFSSPRQNSISRTIDYSIESLLFSIYGGMMPPAPYETNITFSKSNVTYDDSTDWQSNPLNLLAYRFQPYDSEFLFYQYYGKDKQLWFNISFTYQYKVHTYYITTPKFYEVFGTIGGLIAFFYFTISCFIVPFNHYKLKYQIGRELYLFDKKKIVETKDKVKKKLKKTEQDRKRLKKINQYSQVKILQAFLLRPFAWISNSYNFNKTLRRVTLIQERVSKDIDISSFYKNLYRARDAIDKQIRNQNQNIKLKLTDIYFKKVITFNPIQYTISSLQNYTKLHRLSSYQQMIVFRAMKARINIRQILANEFLQNEFGVVGEHPINLGMLNDTQNSINSSSGGSMASSIAEQSVVDDN